VLERRDWDLWARFWALVHLERWVVSCCVARESCWESRLRPLGEEAGEISESEDSGIQPGRAVSVKGFASVACFSRVRASIVARVSGARVLLRVCRRGEIGVDRVRVVRCGERGGLSVIVWAVVRLVGRFVVEQGILFEQGGMWDGLLGGVGVCVGVNG
jgi:hypothetical protein